MTRKNLRVALVGCGRIAGHHCRSIIEVKNADLAATCDLDIEKARAYGKEFGVPYYSNYREMLESEPEIDVVAVITPSGMHFEHTVEIIQSFQKHVIVEKPTFMRPDQLTEAYSIAGDHNCRIFPVFQNRYNKAVQRVKAAIENNELGVLRVVSVRVRWCRPQRYYDLAPWRGTYSMDGGALSNQGIHHIDLLRYLGGEVSRVNATMKTLGAEIEVEDTVIAILEWKSGCIGSVEVTTAARPGDFEASISLVGSKGLAQIGGIAVNELQIFTPDPEACPEYSEDFLGINGHGAVYGYGHTSIYQGVVSEIFGGTAYSVTQKDAANTLALLNSFYLSDEEGDWVDPGAGLMSSRLGCPNEKLSKLYRTPRQADSSRE